MIKQVAGTSKTMRRDIIYIRRSIKFYYQVPFTRILSLIKLSINYYLILLISKPMRRYKTYRSIKLKLKFSHDYLNIC